MRRTSNQKLDKKGFTIIEVLIVLAIAALILMIIFLEVPILEMHHRNNLAKHDASLLLTSILDCVYTNGESYCQIPSHLNIKPSQFSIYTGFHYGATPPAAIGDCGPYGTTPPQCPPSQDQPNWIFGLSCKPDGSGYGPMLSHAVYVGFIQENDDGTARYRCIGG